MKLLSKFEQMSVAAGLVIFTSDYISVTGESKMSLNGYSFSSEGAVLNAKTKEVIHDFVKGDKSYCIPNMLFTASPIQGGYKYKIGSC